MISRMRITTFVFGVLFAVSPQMIALAQEPVASTPTTAAESQEQIQKDKEVAERKATALLQQIVGEVQLLKLPENRIRVQIAAGDMLWKRSEAQARSLFTLAGDAVGEMMRSTEVSVLRSAAQLRREVVLTAAQHDALLAYQLLATTKSATPVTDPGMSFRRPSPDANLDEELLARIAAIDPKLAAQKVEEELTKGAYPNTLPQVISNLQPQDKEAAAKLTARVVSKLQSENILANVQAQSLAMNLLRSGPVLTPNTTSTPPEVSSANDSQSNLVQTRYGMSSPVLNESSFQDLMNTVVDAGLRATPQTASTTGGQDQRGPNSGRGRRNFGMAQNTNIGTPSDAQVEQQNARRLLAGLQMIMPLIEKYLPARATAVRAKALELGMGNTQRETFNRLGNLMRDGTADSLLAAAPNAPATLQSRLYQQAAQKALAAGDGERARQIANDHLDPATRDRVLQRVDFQLIAKKVSADNLDELRQALANLHNDDERIDLLLQLASQAQWASSNQTPAVAAPADSKLALKFLAEAQRLTNRRATSYAQLEQNLRVADALAALETARSFEVIDPGINQLNELLGAAAVLSGFEVNIFRDGELPLAGGSGLGDMVARYGQVLATLAKTDFARAESSANKFQLAEPRLLSQLAIVRSVLGVPQAVQSNRIGPGRGLGRGRQ